MIYPEFPSYINTGLVRPGQIIKYNNPVTGEIYSYIAEEFKVYSLPPGVTWCTVDDELRVNLA